MPFFDIILHPDATMPGMLKKVDMRQAHLINFLNGAIVGLGLALFILGMAYLLSEATGLNEVPLFVQLRTLGLLALIVIPILNGIYSVISSAVYYWIFSRIASYFGGKGTFEGNYYLAAQLSLRFVSIFAILFVLMIIPIVNLLVILCILPVFIYMFYLSVLAGSIANKISKWKALGIVIVVAIIITILNQLLFGAVGLLFTPLFSA